MMFWLYNKRGEDKDPFSFNLLGGGGGGTIKAHKLIVGLSLVLTDNQESVQLGGYGFTEGEIEAFIKFLYTRNLDHVGPEEDQTLIQRIGLLCAICKGTPELNEIYGKEFKQIQERRSLSSASSGASTSASVLQEGLASPPVIVELSDSDNDDNGVQNNGNEEGSGNHENENGNGRSSSKKKRRTRTSNGSSVVSISTRTTRSSAASARNDKGPSPSVGSSTSISAAKGTPLESPSNTNTVLKSPSNRQNKRKRPINNVTTTVNGSKESPPPQQTSTSSEQTTIINGNEDDDDLFVATKRSKKSVTQKRRNPPHVSEFLRKMRQAKEGDTILLKAETYELYHHIIIKVKNLVISGVGAASILKDMRKRPSKSSILVIDQEAEKTILQNLKIIRLNDVPMPHGLEIYANSCTLESIDFENCGVHVTRSHNLLWDLNFTVMKDAASVSQAVMIAGEGEQNILEDIRIHNFDVGIAIKSRNQRGNRMSEIYMTETKYGVTLESCCDGTIVRNLLYKCPSIALLIKEEEEAQAISIFNGTSNTLVEGLTCYGMKKGMKVRSIFIGNAQSQGDDDFPLPNGNKVRNWAAPGLLPPDISKGGDNKISPSIDKIPIKIECKTEGDL